MWSRNDMAAVRCTYTAFQQCSLNDGGYCGATELRLRFASRLA